MELTYSVFSYNCGLHISNLTSGDVAGLEACGGTCAFNEESSLTFQRFISFQCGQESVGTGNRTSNCIQHFLLTQQ